MKNCEIVLVLNAKKRRTGYNKRKDWLNHRAWERDGQAESEGMQQLTGWGVRGRVVWTVGRALVKVLWHKEHGPHEDLRGGPCDWSTQLERKTESGEWGRGQVMQTLRNGVLGGFSAGRLVRWSNRRRAFCPVCAEGRKARPSFCNNFCIYR